MTKRNLLNSSKTQEFNHEVICGIDEAGRGPVLGPMVICGVCFLEAELKLLPDIGVKDSKKLSPKKRSELAKIIKNKCKNYKTIIVSAQEIDAREKKRITLNRLEEIKMAEIIEALKPNIIYIDAADVNEVRFAKSIKTLLKYSPNKIISKHKADDLYPIVSASSIIAKDMRDSIIEELKKNYGDFGSGYPSDTRTIEFLREWIKEKKKAPPFARKSWETTKKIIREEISNAKITDFVK
ncbi:MAG: ribonuclease HII [Candidatus Lokiarchaeota archaeon]|nr:ribonuclease HII [Candidatus Lokiarchaeota archaeon]